MKKFLLTLLLAAPVLFSSCSKEETTISGIDTIEYGKRLPVTKSDLVKYEVLRNLTDGKYQYMVFKNNVAGVLITDLNNRPQGYAYSTQWGVSNNTLTVVTEKGVTMTFEVSKEYKKTSEYSHILTVYLKESDGKEYAYDCVEDGSNSAVAASIWNIINEVRTNQ